MRGWTWGVLTVVVLAFLTTGNRPTPPAETPQPPVITLRRASSASYFDPAKVNPLFVLVIGSDVRAGDPRTGRGDSLHIVAIDTKRGRGTIVGIPRDSYVPIPGSGTNKINAALYFGGPERMVATVSQLSGIPIHYWASVEFSRFIRLVDELGGVELDVPYAMSDPFSGAFFQPGKQHMNGGEALAFARNRKGAPGGDVGRSENQGRLLLAGLSKFRVDARNPLTLGRYLRAFSTHVATNVPTKELISLALIGRRINPAQVPNLVIPTVGGSAGAASVVFVQPGAHEIFAKIRDDAVL